MIRQITTNIWNTSATSTFKPKAAIYSPDSGGIGKPCLIWFGGRGEAASIAKLTSTYIFANLNAGWKPDFNIITFEGNGSGVCNPINGQSREDYYTRILEVVKKEVQPDTTKIYMAGLSGGGCTIMEWMGCNQLLCDSIAAILPASPMADEWQLLRSKVNLSKVKSIGIGGSGSSDLSFLNNLKGWSNKATSQGGYAEVRTVVNGGHGSGTWNGFYSPTSDVWPWLLQQKTGTVIDPVKEIAKYEVSFFDDGSNKISKISGVDVVFSVSN